MNTFLNRLKSLEEEIGTAIIGMGAMGKGLFYQCHITPGIKCLAIADLDISKCVEAAKMLSLPYKEVSSLDEMNKAVEDNILAITCDGELLAKATKVQVLQEATCAIEEGATFVLTALEHKKHVALMNAEIDLIYGPYFMQVAKENGVVCTSIDGDQYGVIKGLIADMELWGFELVMGGNIKGYLDLYANPTMIIPEADKRNLDYKMCTSYTDGTKLNIEMAILANAYGMKTPIPGMYGPKMKHVNDYLNVIDVEKAWGEDKVPFVDYVLGSEPNGGVFAVGYHEHPYQQDMMSYYKMGDGPFYVFYRPMHLCHVEAIKSVIMTVLDNEALLMPVKGFEANVFSYAKIDLKAGETLDGLGGYKCYGFIENTTPSIEPDGLPILLAENVTLKRDIKKNQRITMNDINYNPKSPAFDYYYKALAVSKQL